MAFGMFQGRREGQLCACVVTGGVCKSCDHRGKNVTTSVNVLRLTEDGGKGLDLLASA